MQFTDKQMMEGRRRLKARLPEARTLAARMSREAKTEMRVTSTRGQATTSHVRLNNLKALIVHRVRGGWQADLLLKATPPGVGNVLGTPNSAPLATREEADEASLHILAMAVHLSELNSAGPARGEPEPDRIFYLHEIEFRAPPQVIDLVAGMGGAARLDMSEMREHALARMEETCMRLGIGPETTPPDLKTIPDTEHSELFVLVCMLLSCNVLEYPVHDTTFPRQDGTDERPVA